MAVAERLSAVDTYLDGLQHARKAEVEALRRLIHDSVPGLNERIKWNAPSFGPGDDDRVTMRLHPGDRLQLILHRGAKAAADDFFRFEDPDKLLSWAAEPGAAPLGSVHDPLAGHLAAGGPPVG